MANLKEIDALPAYPSAEIDDLLLSGASKSQVCNWLNKVCGAFSGEEDRDERALEGLVKYCAAPKARYFLSSLGIKLESDAGQELFQELIIKYLGDVLENFDPNRFERDEDRYDAHLAYTNTAYVNHYEWLERRKPLLELPEEVGLQPGFADSSDLAIWMKGLIGSAIKMRDASSPEHKLSSHQAADYLVRHYCLGEDFVDIAREEVEQDTEDGACGLAGSEKEKMIAGRSRLIARSVKDLLSYIQNILEFRETSVEEFLERKRQAVIAAKKYEEKALARALGLR